MCSGKTREEAEAQVDAVEPSCDQEQIVWIHYRHTCVDTRNLSEIFQSMEIPLPHDSLFKNYEPDSESTTPWAKTSGCSLAWSPRPQLPDH